MGYTNSSLVNYIKLSPNKNSPRNHNIDTITIHCYVGQVTAKQGCNCSKFVKRNAITGASCNYVVGYDGSIGLCVNESDRSWCSSNKANDNRAVTIEVASETKSPYAVTQKAMESLILLCADICKRNEIKYLKWSTNKSDRKNHRNGCNMTVHRDYAAKSCPGNYLYERQGYIADEVNKILDENNNNKVDIVVEQFEPLKGDQNHFATIIKNIKLSLNKDYGLSFVIDSSINDILLTNLSNVVLSINAYKSNITYSLQQLLKWWGYDAVINGKYGSNTECIVSLVQSQVGLKKTGTTTKEFWYKILGK